MEEPYLDDMCSCAKAYMEHIGKIDWAIRRQKDEIERERELLDGVRSITNTDRVFTTRKTDQMADGIAMLIEMIAEFSGNLAYYVEEKRQAEECLGSLDPIHRTILSLRYIHGEKWVRIGMKTQYSVRYVYQLHNDALKELYRVLPSEWKLNAEDLAAL